MTHKTKDEQADSLVEGFRQMRERCEHYEGIRETQDSVQCAHPDRAGAGFWCAMDQCPRVIACAQAHQLGWD